MENNTTSTEFSERTRRWERRNNIINTLREEKKTEIPISSSSQNRIRVEPRRINFMRREASNPEFFSFFQNSNSVPSLFPQLMPMRQTQPISPLFLSTAALLSQLSTFHSQENLDLEEDINSEGGNDYEELLHLEDIMGNVKPKNTPASPRLINRLPTYVFTEEIKNKKTKIENALTSCSICLSDFEIEQKIRILPCFHEFCQECIDNWLSTNEKCPICTHPVSEVEEEEEEVIQL